MKEEFHHALAELIEEWKNGPGVSSDELIAAMENAIAQIREADKRAEG